MRKFTILILLSLLLTGIPGVTLAQSDDDDQEGYPYTDHHPRPCDSSFNEALNSRAWTMGKRELEWAQTIILKEDSTQQLGCFKYRLQAVVHWTPSVFVAMIPAINVIYDNLINQAVIDEWVAGNFGNINQQNYGGGFYPLAGAYNCDNMNKIWMLAKCQDMRSGSKTSGNNGQDAYSPPDDQFMTFAELANNDPRQWPWLCKDWHIEEDEIPDSQQDRHAKWWLNITKGYRTAEAPPRQGHPHAIITYLPSLDARDCSGVRPVPTGYIVKVGAATYPDAVCPATACWYNPRANSCNP